MRAKFENCAGRALPEAAVAKAGWAIEELEKLTSVRELTALLEPAGAGKGGIRQVSGRSG
jgi:hypothetical protein